jgi:hypothetical protein
VLEAKLGSPFAIVYDCRTVPAGCPGGPAEALTFCNDTIRVEPPVLVTAPNLKPMLWMFFEPDRDGKNTLPITADCIPFADIAVMLVVFKPLEKGAGIHKPFPCIC